MRNQYISLTRLGSVVLLLLTISACSALGSPSNQPARPIVSITSPANSSSFAIGQQVSIAFAAADVKGVAQVELSIDGQPVRVEVVEPPVNSFVASHTWVPETVGSHLVEVRAFNVDGDVSELVQIVLTVFEAAVAEVTPTLPSVVDPIPTPTQVLAGTEMTTPLPPLPPSPTSAPTETKPMATALVALNVRSGPSLDYPVVGRLAQGQTAEITGRDPYNGWWQIVFNSASGDRGWIAAGGEFSAASNTEGVPIVEAPSPPPPTAPPPSPTPDQLKPTIFSFTANRYTIAAGESVKLSWDLANAEAAYLHYGDVEEGVVAPGSKTVSPTSDTVYKLVARNSAGETIAELTIKVGGATATPVSVWRDGKIRIANGQSVDFDQGLVQNGTGGGADFYWDGAQQRFVPQGSATGALLSISFDSITLDRCLSASYGQPITGVDGSSQVTGCYKTGEGRYGKFFVSEWDLAANLTVNWLTWDYK